MEIKIYKPKLKEVLDVLPLHSIRVVKLGLYKHWETIDLRFDSNGECIYGESLVNLIDYDSLFGRFEIYIDELITNERIK